MRFLGPMAPAQARAWTRRHAPLRAVRARRQEPICAHDLKLLRRTNRRRIMRRTLLTASLAVVLSAIPIAASAARGYALGGAQIFAGPGNDYPVVAQVGSGAAVNVNGCLSDYSWCDVSIGASRG